MVTYYKGKQIVLYRVEICHPFATGVLHLAEKSTLSYVGSIGRGST